MTRPHASSIISFMMCVIALISRMLSRRDLLRPIRTGTAFGVDERAVPGRAPVRGLLVEDALDVLRVAGVPGREVEVAPVAAVALRRRRIPRVVRVGERHPDEPVGVFGQRVEVRDRAVGDPVGVVPVARDGVDARLGRAGVAARLGREQRREALRRLPAVRVDRATCRSAAACACRQRARASRARRARSRGTGRRARAPT